jgi:hypothetical protein
MGSSTLANTIPVAWSTPDLNDSSLLALINTLPPRVGLPGFTDLDAALNWMDGTGDFFLLKNGIENIVTGNLLLYWDAGWYTSYPGTGTNVNDLTSSNFDGTLLNSVGFNSTGVGAFSFDGSDDAISGGDVCEVTTGPFSIEAWIRMNSLGTFQVVMQKGNPGVGSNPGYRMRISDTGVIEFVITSTAGQETQINSNSNLSAGVWYHIHCSRSGTNMKIYINGVLSTNGTGTSGSIDASSSPFYVGRQDGGNWPFNGLISSVKFYDAQLTPEQVLQNYNAQKDRFGIISPVQNALLELDAGNINSYPQTGTVWYNLASQNYNANLQNGLSWSSTSGGTFVFDGTDDYASIPTLNNFNFGSAITVGAWLRNIGGDYRGIISNTYAVGTGFDLRFGRENWSGGTNDGTALNMAVRTSNGFYSHTIDGTLNSWGYYLYTYDGSNLVSYKNGNIFSGGTPASGTLGSLSNDVIIGARNILGEYFNGSLSNVHLFTRALKPSEIQQNFYALSNRYGLGIVRNGLVSNYDAGNFSSYNGSGSTFFDISGSMYDGSLINGTFFSPTASGTLVFDGVDDYVSLGNSINFASSQFSVGYTVELWVQPKVTVGNSTLFSSAQGTSGTEWQIYIWYNTDQKFGTAQRYGGNQNDFQTVSTFAPDNWYHVTVTSNNTTCRIYVNGVEQNNNGTGQPDNQPANREVRLGSFKNFTNYSKGNISICRIYNRTLSAGEVLSNYNVDKRRYEIGYPSALAILNDYPNAPDGLYLITPPGSPTSQMVYCDMTNGGWMLVSSNDARDTTIPGGTGRNNVNYILSRSTVLGTPDPNADYIIGSIIDYMTFTQVRIFGWGYQSTNGTYSFPNNLGTYITATWSLTTTGSSRFTEKVPRANVTIGGNSTVASAAAYFVLDAVRNDIGYDANVNQSTIGAAGVASSTGDPSEGCYLGHGISEGSYEGWYNTNSTVFDTQGYTTWVK